MAGAGSTGNVIAALASFFIPGLGQLLQGRVGKAVFFVVAFGVVWFVLLVLTFGILSPLGVLVNIWAALDAALWKPRGR